MWQIYGYEVSDEVKARIKQVKTASKDPPNNEDPRPPILLTMTSVLGVECNYGG